MGSKRAEKAKKRSKRQAKRQVRRARHAAESAKKEAQRQTQRTLSALAVAGAKVSEPPSTKSSAPAKVDRPTAAEPTSAKTSDPPAEATKQEAQRDPHIGYVAFNGVNMVCQGDACIVVGSRREMQRILDRLGCPRAIGSVHATSFEQIFEGMQLGGAYCFNEEAYSRFLEPARRRGMPLTEQEFSDLGPHSLDLLWVRLPGVRAPQQP